MRPVRRSKGSRPPTAGSRRSRSAQDRSDTGACLDQTHRDRGRAGNCSRRSAPGRSRAAAAWAARSPTSTNSRSTTSRRPLTVSPRNPRWGRTGIPHRIGAAVVVGDHRWIFHHLSSDCRHFFSSVGARAADCRRVSRNPSGRGEVEVETRGERAFPPMSSQSETRCRTCSRRPRASPMHRRFRLGRTSPAPTPTPVRPGCPNPINPATAARRTCGPHRHLVAQ